MGIRDQLPILKSMGMGRFSLRMFLQQLIQHCPGWIGGIFSYI